MNHKNVKLARVITVSLLLGLVVLPTAFNAIAGQDVPTGGTLTAVLLAEPPDIHPYSGRWNSGFVSAQLFSKLLTLDDDMNLIPELATDLPVISEAEKSYTFTLRSGVKWHDGTPFSAEDVKFSFEEIIAQYDNYGLLYFQGVRVEIIDESTVKIFVDDFLPGIQMKMFGGEDTSIVPKHVLENVVDSFLDQPFIFDQPVGTGPFKMKEWNKGSYIILERFADYWDAPRPYLNEIVIRIMPEPASIVAAFLQGEVDYIFRGMPYENYDTLNANPDLDVFLHKRPPYKAMIFLNTKEVALPIRQAWSYAINRDDIVELATSGLCDVTDSFFTPDIVPLSPTRTIYEYNPDKAKQILDDAGYTADESGDRGIEIELLMRRGEPEESLTAELMRDDLAEVGITLVLNEVDFGVWLELVYNYTYETALLKRWVQDFWGAQLFMSEWIQPGLYWSNSYQYDNPELDTAYAGWMTAADPAEGIRNLQKVDDILTRDLPEIPLYDVTWLVVLRKTFQPAPGAITGILPDGRWVFADSIEYMYWTEGTVVSEYSMGAIMLAATILVTTTKVLVEIRKRRKAN